MAYILQQARRVAFDSPKASTTQIRRLSRSAPLSAFVEALEADGCVIVQDFTDKTTLHKADQEVRPYLNQQEKGHKVGGRVPFSQTNFTPLISSSPPRKDKNGNSTHRKKCDGSREVLLRSNLSGFMRALPRIRDDTLVRRQTSDYNEPSPTFHLHHV